MKTYHFEGVATVSVHTKVEATTKKEALKMVRDGDCLWVCDDVDGDVEKLKLTDVEE